MPGVKALVGCSTRYIAGRNAVQTVYWRETAEHPNKLIKMSKTLQFKNGEMPKRAIQNAHTQQSVKFN